MKAARLPAIPAAVLSGLGGCTDTIRASSPNGTQMENIEPRPTAERMRDGMPERARRTLDDGEAEPETMIGLMPGQHDAIELVEDGILLLVGDARAGIPDLDVEPLGTVPAADQHAAAAGIAGWRC